MDIDLSRNDQQMIVSSFLEIAIGQTAEIAEEFLKATNWKLEEAIELFYSRSEFKGMASRTSNSQPIDNVACCDNPNAARECVVNEVHPPLPVIREVLYAHDPMLDGTEYPSLGPNFEEGSRHPDVWNSDQGSASTTNDSVENLFRPPLHLMYRGCFEKAKGAASAQNKWLLVNLQSNEDFSSNLLNRDTWAHETLSQTISKNFIFWQADEYTTEGRKVCTFYKLVSVPAVLVVDPITGQKMRSWYGMIQPESLVEDLTTFTNGGPKDHDFTSRKRPRKSSVTPLRKVKVARNNISEENEQVFEALADSMKSKLKGVISSDEEESDKEFNEVISTDKEATNADKEEETCSIEKPRYPPLPEEPKADKNLLCRVRVRLPDGRRVQRKFLLSDPMQLLWSLCYSQLEENETRSVDLTFAVPGASMPLQYDSKLTFDESGIANSMITVTWK